MKSSELAKSLNLTLLVDVESEIHIEGVYIGDLLSIVMAKAKNNYAWITIQTHINIIAVAELLELSCIIIVENMEVDNDTLDKAKELNIPIFKTEKTAYEIACILYDMGIK
ncbi:MAG: DRTGG domain-containing protein [Tissierellia bacterium]|nr:DRTGG domain-containing protein [Tissierellia bacterium]MDD4780640.1 DRTGG domain-containing protein [Tissierellia bacterium]